MKNEIKSARRLHVQQVLEGFEVILGWETRNKYRILDQDKRPVAYAAENSTGIGGAIMRQFFGHWKAFQVTIFNQERQPQYQLHFPFRWFFKTLWVKESSGRPIGYLQQRFSLFRKKFDIYHSSGKKVAYINSSFFRYWTFEVFAQKKVGTIQKKWSGALTEFFTDKDNFIVSFADPNLDEDTKTLMVASCLMVDIVYFENNQGKGLMRGMFN